MGVMQAVNNRRDPPRGIPQRRATLIDLDRQIAPFDELRHDEESRVFRATHVAVIR